MGKQKKASFLMKYAASVDCTFVLVECLKQISVTLNV
jgi:hypothetical protein